MNKQQRAVIIDGLTNNEVATDREMWIWMTTEVKISAKEAGKMIVKRSYYLNKSI